MLELLPKAFGYGGSWLGGSILLGLLGAFAWPGALGADPQTVGSSPAVPPKQTGNPQLVIFQAGGFPTVDAPAISGTVLEEALCGLAAITCATPLALNAELAAESARILVLPYGSAFPVDSWIAIRSFLQRGGGLVLLGGAPFHQPVRWVPAEGGRAMESDLPGEWVLGPRQPSFAHELLIGPAEEIRPADFVAAGPLAVKPAFGSDWARVDPAMADRGQGSPAQTGEPAEGGVLNPAELPPPAFPLPERAFALTVRFATRKDLPAEDGAAGPRDALLRPLVQVLDGRGLPVACPLLEIDRLRGDDAGARWVLAPSDATLDAATIHGLLLRALAGATELVVRPVWACVEPGEIPRLRLQLRRPGDRGLRRGALKARVTVTDESGAVRFETAAALEGPADVRMTEVAIHPKTPLTPGYYQADIDLPEFSGCPRSARTGFWVRDAGLLLKGPAVTASRDWLRKDGHVFPIIGTTYMAADVHRKFLFEPEPAGWERDFARMAAAGVNFVRTGIWTGWSRLMLDPGAPDDGALRALDAFVHTAARHGIVVCFTFFAFQPPLFGGDNPYLDPRAREGQRTLLTLVARRYRGVGWVHYDLINEPSYSPPDALWTDRPVGDRHERAAWERWVADHVTADPAELRQLWRDASADVLAPPQADELFQAMSREDRHPRKAFDFHRFTQDVLTDWAAEMRAALQAAGGRTLVTLGQDEGGTGSRPGPQFHSPAVDYTCVHTWWNNDDLLWDAVMTKTPEKPHLIQETGLMRLEDLDGCPWRNPAEAASLLERKFAQALAGRGAGAVQWAWNVNPYQPVDNEAVIGLFRPDGTVKPELAVLSAFARFLAAAAPALDDFEPDPVVMVIPHARQFAGRPQADTATRRVIRILADRYGIVPTAVSDLRLTTGRLATAKLVLVPAPEFLTEDAAGALAVAAAKGVKVLITGPVTGDPYGRKGPALAALHLAAGERPLALREPTPWGADGSRSRVWATFPDNRSQWLRAAAGPPLDQLDGSVWQEPLPLEFAAEEEPLARLLAAALRAAAIPVTDSAVPLTVRVLTTPATALVVAINETSQPLRREVPVAGRTGTVSVPAGRCLLLVLDRVSGRTLAEYPAE